MYAKDWLKMNCLPFPDGDMIEHTNPAEPGLTLDLPII
jgi:hypothetical protein